MHIINHLEPIPGVVVCDQILPTLHLQLSIEGNLPIGDYA